LQINTAPTGATGEVWEINPGTGARTGSSPHATFSLKPDGSWGPLKVSGEKHYEIALTRAGSRTIHFYYQPFIRSSYIIRLTTVEPDAATAVNTNTGPNHSAVVVTRYREWWRTHDAA